MLKLYHGRTSVCAIKARLTLAEKGLDWDGELLTLQGDQFDPAYMKLNPNAVVPTLVHDGEVIIESTVIMHYLNDAFPDPPLMPAAPIERARVNTTTKMMDEYVHNSCTVLTFATANRAGLARMTPEERAAALSKSPSRQRTEAKLQVAEHGMDAPLVVEATRNHVKLLNWIEAAMARGPWIAGDTYSLADIAATPYIWRLDCLRLSKMWDDKPGVAGWFERIRARPSFDVAITSQLTQADVDRYAGFEPDPWPKVRSILEAA
jgi:glutathione S-transferase